MRFYSAEIVLTLAHIHRMGMIYRDLKPANVLLCADGHIKLVDLGGVIDVGGKVLGYSGGNTTSSQADSTLFAHSTPRNVADISASLKGDNDLVAKGAAVQRNRTSDSKSARVLATKPEGGDLATVSTKATSVVASGKENKNTYKAAEQPTMMKARSIMGTGGFMAPEVRSSRDLLPI